MEFGLYLYSFLNLGVGCRGWLTARLGVFALGKEPMCPFYRRSVGHHNRSGQVWGTENRSFCRQRFSKTEDSKFSQRLFLTPHISRIVLKSYGA